MTMAYSRRTILKKNPYAEMMGGHTTIIFAHPHYQLRNFYILGSILCVPAHLRAFVFATGMIMTVKLFTVIDHIFDFVTPNSLIFYLTPSMWLSESLTKRRFLSATYHDLTAMRASENGPAERKATASKCLYYYCRP
jgi:hypothetical protein